MSKPWTLVALLLLLALTVGSPALAGGTLVLFDTGHGQRFLSDRDGPLDFSRLAGIFGAEGISLTQVGTPFTDQALAPAAGVVISGPFAPVTPAEAEALVRFVARGGAVAIMLHIAPPAATLIGRLGGAVVNGVVREAEEVLDGNPLNFRVTRLSPHPLLAGIDSFSLYGGWPLLARAPGTALIASTSPDAWVDLDGDRELSPADAVQSFGVVLAGTVGQGNFAVFGDDAIFQNRFLTGENERLAQNLAKWFRREAK